jgi:cell division protein FtsQ
MSLISKRKPSSFSEERTLFSSDKKNTRSVHHKRLRTKKNKIYFLGPIYFSIIVFFILILSFWFSGYFVTAERYIIEKIHRLTGLMGFQVKDIIVQGRNKIPQAVLAKAINVRIGDALTEHGLDDIKDRLQQIDWVKESVVYRQLPNQLFIKIIERYPIAIWHNQKNNYVVDNNGVAIAISSLKDYSTLPHFTGDGAPEKIHEVLKLIEEYPDIKSHLTSFSRIRKRRWDMVLFKNVIIKLPEDSLNTEILNRALKKISTLLNLKTITEESTKTVDLRLEGKIYIQKK